MKNFKQNTFGRLLEDQKEVKSIQQRVDEWNEAYPVGVPVIGYRAPDAANKNSPLEFETTTRSIAFKANNEARIYLNGCKDSFLLSEIRLNLVEFRKMNDTEGLLQLHKPQPKQGETKDGIEI